MYSVRLRVSLFFVFGIVLVLLPLNRASSLNVINEFQDNVTVQIGDVIQCEITKTDLEETDKPIFTQPCHVDRICYVYHEVSTKCFSFKVKTQNLPFIAFGNTAALSPGHVEIVVDYNKESVIRERALNFDVINLKTIPSNDLVTEAEYRGFWVRWLDDHLLEIGRDNESVPFLSHKFDRKLEIDYVGIMSWGVKGAWIINRDPKCPGAAGFGAKAQKKMKTESDCMILY